jgi:mannose-6-phosphate isomerase
VKLERRYVEKPWGRTQLPPMFDAPAGKRIGEVWFTGGDELPLLAKYIFTNEWLSIQVHPNDAQARARGLPHGKSECWYILDAEPAATLGLGLTRAVGKDELRQAAIDGSIEQLMDWRGVAAGDFVFVPAGTIHAIGAGISLLEFQQNSDVTYRLYDYGRPRELHLDDGVAVADARPFEGRIQQLSGDGELVTSTHFKLAYTLRDTFEDRRRWIMPIDGKVRVNGESAGTGDCLLVEAREQIEVQDAQLLIGTTA